MKVPIRHFINLKCISFSFSEHTGFEPATLWQSQPERFNQLSYGSPTVDAEIRKCLLYQSYSDCSVI
uniref:Uncharacterized protein n=1 Tax=Pararge aegeria TaxID=116150 RepID=S4P0Q9_9NEOP